MPSALDIEPFSQPEWSDSSDSTEPGPLPQLGFFVPVRCRCERTSHHVCRRRKKESPRSRRSVSQCSCGSASRRSSAAASPMPLPPLNNTMEMYVEPVVEDYSAVVNLLFGVIIYCGAIQVGFEPHPEEQTLNLIRACSTDPQKPLPKNKI